MRRILSLVLVFAFAALFVLTGCSDCADGDINGETTTAAQTLPDTTFSPDEEISEKPNDTTQPIGVTTEKPNVTTQPIDNNTTTLDGTSAAPNGTTALPDDSGEEEGPEDIGKIESEGLEFISHGDGTCKVVQIGNCKDTELVIPTRSPDGELVTGIGAYAFSGCTDLIGITIPDSVTSIGREAFCDTAYYKDEANWENRVLYIGKHLIKAKEDIYGTYIIKEGTLTVADYAFYGCGDLTDIDIPDSVRYIGEGTFDECTGLGDAIFPEITLSNAFNMEFYNVESKTGVFYA